MWITRSSCERLVYGFARTQVGGKRTWHNSALMVRGTAAGLEFVFGKDGFDDAWAEIAARLMERPDFYRGSHATAIFDGDPPGDEALRRLREQSLAHGITLRGLYGGEAFAAVAERLELAYLGEPARPTVSSFERKRAARAASNVDLTEHARSLDADFAGARADIAKRRARGEPSVPKPVFASVPARLETPPGDSTPVEPPKALGAPERAKPPAPSTLYHRGTLRGGQTLQQLGSIVVVGDVNPGAELVATGDIVVFGALRGTAHAGAQGDAAARVYALELRPTQLRIATCIAAGDAAGRGREPEVAYIESERIAIAPYTKIGAP